jgi:hypothetical protein
MSENYHKSQQKIKWSIETIKRGWRRFGERKNLKTLLDREERKRQSLVHFQIHTNLGHVICPIFAMIISILPLSLFTSLSHIN